MALICIKLKIYEVILAYIYFLHEVVSYELQAIKKPSKLNKLYLPRILRLLLDF